MRWFRRYILNAGHDREIYTAKVTHYWVQIFGFEFKWKSANTDDQRQK